VDEAQWLTWNDPAALVGLLFPAGRARASARKYRLFACAGARLACRVHRVPSVVELLEVAERYADGDADMDQVWAAYFAARSEHGEDGWPFRLIREAVLPPAVAAADSLARPFHWLQTLPAHAKQAWDRGLCDLLRCFTGQRFQRTPLDPAWLQAQDGLVCRLAQDCYDSRDFAAMPVLGDALEEAGCCDPVVLAHCRQQAEHYRGCFLVDGVLGKG
jgi:hypothetical protein